MDTTNTTTNNVSKYLPQYILERCSNCSGYGSIGRNPRITCPTCGGLGSNKIPVVPVKEVKQ